MRMNRFISFLIVCVFCLAFLPGTVSAADKNVVSVGASYTVTYLTPIENAYPKLAYTPETKLTDGKIAKADYGDPAWLTLYRGTAVQVDIDLGSITAVSGVKIGELQLKSYGVLCSRYLRVYLSEDGENYCFAGEFTDDKTVTSDTKKRVELECSLDKSYLARYVRAEFSSDIFTMVDEVSVLGSETSSASAPGDDYFVREKKGIASSIDGISSVCLIYTSANATQEMLKPYVAYVDASGEAQDKMFDSLLFLGMPSTASGSKYMHKEDMEKFVDMVMGDSTGLNLTALDTVVGSLKGGIFAEDYKYPVFIAVPFPGVFSESFGEIDGKKITGSNLANREKIVDWYIGFLSERFNGCGFENLELKGLYWFEEIIQYGLSSDEEELVAHFNESAHEKGFKTMWIPYYSASGIDVIDKLGFDAVTMQSGYAFDGSDETGTPAPQACDDCAAAAELFGMGMEFEVDMNRNKYYDRFAQYVHSAYRAGIMDGGIMAMYQVGNHLYQSAVGSASIRNLYELTYKYCSKNYTEKAPVITSGATVTIKTGEYMNNKLEIIDEDTPLNQLKIAQMNKPSGIFFSATGNGFFELEAYNTEPGTYVASFSVTDGFNESNLVEVVITVEPAVEESSQTPESSVEESIVSAEPPSEHGPAIWIIAVIAAAVLVIAAVAVIIYKTKNKKH